VENGKNGKHNEDYKPVVERGVGTQAFGQGNTRRPGSALPLRLFRSLTRHVWRGTVAQGSGSQVVYTSWILTYLFIDVIPLSEYLPVGGRNG
jgi:hypothetical protein